MLLKLTGWRIKNQYRHTEHSYEHPLLQEHKVEDDKEQDADHYFWPKLTLQGKKDRQIIGASA